MACAISLASFLLVTVVGAASSSKYPTRFPNVTWDNSLWQLTTTNLDQGHYQARMSVANGYHGINVAALGPFFEVDSPVDGDNINGWPLFDRRQTFATVGGFWDSEPLLNGTNFPWLSQYGWDTAISGIPHWSGIVIDLGDDDFLAAATNKTTISNFTSTLDMKQGLMNWAYTWTPKKGVSFDIVFQMFAHRLYVNQGFVSLNITAHNSVNITVVNVLNGDCAVRTNFVKDGEDDDFIYSAVSPHGVDAVTAYVYAGLNISGANFRNIMSSNLDRVYAGSNQSSIAQSAEVALGAGQTASIAKYVGVASSDAFGKPGIAALAAAKSAMSTGYMAARQTHVSEWARIFPPSSVDNFAFPENDSLPNDPNLIEAAIMAVTNPYYLLQQVLTEKAIDSVNAPNINSHSISVSGLASDSYAGQIFWDAEIWMQPGLVAAFPFAGKGIANYRVERYQQALQNIKTAYQSSRRKTQFSANSAAFPWTSGRYGNCTATGPCFDYEYHGNGDIARELANYWIASGDTTFFQQELFPVYDSIASFFSDLLVKNGSKYVLTNMTDPDEYENFLDNGAYTMALFANTLGNANLFRGEFGLAQNSTWTTQSQNVLINRNADADITLEYSGMNASVEVKQADVVLNTYPLRSFGENYTLSDALSDLDWYAAAQSPNGPGMTYAIYSIVANEVSPSGCSCYTYQQYSSQPYVRAPWFQFSEQLLDDATANGGTHPAYPFLTGHGGANQVVLFGYLGLRLTTDWNLHVDPSLPPQIPQIKYRTFYWRGWPIAAFSNQTHTTLSRGSQMSTALGAVPNVTYASMPIPIVVGSPGSNTTSYSLPPGGSVTIPNRRIGEIRTTKNNINQCRSVTSSDEYVPGQFPIAAVDGAASTKWQPMYANKTASITVSIPPGLKVVGISFDWAQAPPVNYTVRFHNVTAISSGVPMISAQHVNISSAYNASTAADFKPYSSNITTATVSGNIYTANYATLSIWGTLANGMKKSEEMNGTGATVAEWNIIVEDASASQPPVRRSVNEGGLGWPAIEQLKRNERFMRDRRWSRLN